MGRERYLISRNPTAQLDKSRPEDKLDTLTSSFFAPLAQNPATTSFDILAGFIYIDKSFVNLGDQVIGMGVGGSHQTNSIPANFYNVAYFSLDSSGTIIKTEGTPASSPGAVVAPVGGFPKGTFPIAIVSYRDNGVGGTGTINSITAADIQDVRAFLAGNYNKATFATELINDFKVNSTPIPSTAVTVEKGSLFFNSGEFAELLSQQVVGFGTSQPYQAPSFPANNYNKALLSFSVFGTLVVTWGTPAPTENAVVLPQNPKDVTPLAIITVRDNGFGGAGTLLPIQEADVKDARPFFNNFFGTLPVDNLSYCKVTANFPPNQKVRILEGVVYPQGIYSIFPETEVDFNAAGPTQFPATTPGEWRRVLLGINAANQVFFSISASAASVGALVNPPIPNTIIPLAFVNLRDNGAGIPGSILPVLPTDIIEIRPFLGALGSSGSSVIVQRNDLYDDFLMDSYFRQVSYENFTNDDFVDGGNTTANVDAIIDNDAEFSPGQILTTTNVFDNFFGITNVERVMVIADVDVLVGFQVEVSNNGGSNWESTTLNSIHTFSTTGVDLRIRFTNSGGSTITLFSWGIGYNDDPYVPSYMSYVDTAGRMLRKIQTTIKDNSYKNTLNVNQLAGDLYKLGTAALLDNGNKTLPSAYSFQGLLAPVKAVVGPNGTHTTLQAAINDVVAGSLILVDTTALTLTSTVNVNKADLTIMGCGRGSTLTGNGTFVGLNVTSVGVKIKGCKFNNFTTALQIAAENCVVMENYFSTNTIDVDYSGISNVVVEANVSE